VGRDKIVGSSSHSVAPPTRVGLRSTRSRTGPTGTGTPELQRSAPRQTNPPRRSEERSVSVRQIYDGSDCPDSDSLQRRLSRGRSSDACGGTERYPAALTVVAYPGWWGPGCSCAPCRRRGPWSNPSRCGGQRHSPRANGGECCRRRGGRPKRRSARDGGLKACRSQVGLEACRFRAGHVGPPSEESPGALQDVSLRLQLLPFMTLPTCLLMLAFVFLQSC
jgi:hypothetical protein